MCACVGVCASIYMYVETSCMVETRGQSVILQDVCPPCFLRQGFYGLEFTNSARLVGQGSQVSTSIVLGLPINANTARFFVCLFPFGFGFYI